MNKADSLSKLIQSLDKKEISLVRKSLKNRENLESLFLLYLKNDEGLDNIKFQKKEAAFKNISVIRSRLYTLIVKELVTNNTINNDKITLNEIDSNILILAKKGLVLEALQEIKKGYLFAEKLGDSFYMLNFTKRLILIRTILPEKLLPVEWYADDTLESKIKSAITDIYVMRNFIFENKKYLPEELEFKQPSFLDFNEAEIDTLILSTQINYYSWKSSVGDLTNDKQSIFSLIKGIKVFDNLDIAEVKGSYWGNSFYALNMGLILKAIQWDFKEIAEEYLEKMKNPEGFLKEMKEAKKIWPEEIFRLFFLCKFYPDKKEEIKKLAEIMRARDKTDRSVIQGRNFIYLSICNAYFILQDYELFFEYAFEVLSITKKDKYYSEAIYIQIRLMELMLNFERKKIGHNTKLILALKNHIWNIRGNLHPFEKKFFTLFSNTIYSVSKKDLLAFVVQIESELKTEESEDFMMNHAPYLNFSFWLNRVKESC